MLGLEFNQKMHQEMQILNSKIQDLVDIKQEPPYNNTVLYDNGNSVKVLKDGDTLILDSNLTVSNSGENTVITLKETHQPIITTDSITIDPTTLQQYNNSVFFLVMGIVLFFGFMIGILRLLYLTIKK